MAYSVELTARAVRDLEGLTRPDQVRMAARIDSLATNPRPYGCRKLAGKEGFFRIRVGDFRVIYLVRDRKLTILVIRIGNRREVYR